MSPPPAGTLTVSLTEITDSAAIGSTREKSVQLGLSNPGDRQQSWSAARAIGGAWLGIDPSSGTAPSTIGITLSPSGLSLGVRRDTVVITGGSGEQSPARVPVQFTIHPCIALAVPRDTVISDSLTTANCVAPHKTNSFAQVFSFTSSGGDSVSARLLSPDIDTYLIVAGSANGATPALEEDDDCLGESGDACLRYVFLPDSGTYYVEATTAPPGRTGVFTLELLRPRAPQAPTGLEQLRADSTAIVDLGATVSDTTFVFSGVVSDQNLSDSLRLQIEIQPVASGFTGIPSDSSVWVLDGDTATVSISGFTDDTPYHWHARAVDQTGRASSWVPFGGNPESQPDLTVALQEVPESPSGLGQFTSDGSTAIAVGDATTEPTVVLKGLVNDPDPSDQVRLEVEVRPVGIQFSDVPTGSSVGVPIGNVASVTITGLTDNTSYHWQGRTIDQSGNTSSWLSFGGNAETEADFGVTVPGGPGVPTALAQLRGDSLSAIGIGTTIDEATVVFAATVTDPDPGDQVRLEIELRPIALGLSGLPNATSPLVPNGATAFIRFANLDDDTDYHWQVRAVDGAGSVGPWQSFGNNADGVSDFRVAVPASTLVFTTPPGNTAAGSPITPAVIVTAQEPSGVTDTSFTQTIGISITPGTGATGAVLSGQPTVQAVNGVATFGDLSIDRADLDYSLTVTTTGLAPQVSPSFDIVAAGSDQLALITGPSSVAQVALPFAQQPVVQLVDQNSNPVSQAGIGITAVIASGPSGATLSAANAITDGNGRATFAGLGITGTIGSYTLRFTSSGLLPVQSNPITLNLGAPFAATSTAAVPGGQAGSPTSIVLQARDAGGNDLISGGATVAVSVTGANNAVPGVNDNGDGTYSTSYTPTLVGVDNVAITLNGTSVSGSPYSSAVVPGPASAAQTTASVPAGTAGSVTVISVQARDQFGNDLTSSGGNVTAAVTSGPNTGASVAVVDNGDGTYQVTYTPAAVGTDNLQISLNSAVIGGGPYSSLVSPGVASPATTTATVPPTGTAGVQSVITVQARDANGNDLISSGGSVGVSVSGANNGAIVSVTDNNDGSYTATYTPTVSGTDTFVITLNASPIGGGPYSSVVSTAGPSAAQSTATVPAGTAGSVTTIVVQARDQFGNDLPSGGATVVVTITGANPGVPGVTDNGNGTYTASYTPANVGQDNIAITLNGSAIGGSPYASNVSPGGATQLAFLVEPSGAVAGANIAPAMQVAIQDGSGNTVTSSNASVTMAIGNNAGGGTLSGNMMVNAVNGVATFDDLNINRTGSGYTLVASSTGLANATSAAFAITAGTPSQLVFAVQPSNTVAGGNITPAVQVAVQDLLGNVVTSAITPITIELQDNPSNGTLGGGSPVAAVNGVATFPALSIDSAGTGYTLRASGGGFPLRVSDPFDITVGSGNRLAFFVQPSDVTAGSGINPAIQVEVLDQIGNRITTASDAITLSIANNPGGGTLSGTATVNATNGLATFSGLSIERSGVGYTLAASAGTLTSATSAPFNVTAAAASQLVFTQQPSSSVAGAAISPAVTVTVQDVNGNTVLGYATPVGLAIDNNAGGGTLAGGAPVAPVNGVATFAGLSIDRTGNGYTLEASSAALTEPSGAFDITPGVANRLAYVVAPSNTTAGANIAPVQVAVHDVNGNVVTSSAASITVALGANPGGGSLAGTLSVTASSGVATFSNLSIDSAATGYTLAATSTGLTEITSGPFNIIPGSATQLTFTVQPGNTVAGSNIAPPVLVAFQDVLGNTVTTDTRSITVAIGSNPGSGTLTGTVSRNAVAGVATFDDLSINSAANGYTLTANGGSLPQETSAGFDIQVGSGNQLAFLVQPSNAIVGAAIAPPIQVEVLDGSNNRVTTATDAITLVIGANPGSGGVSGNTTVNAVSGVATFSNIRLDQVANGYTLVALASGLLSDESNPLNITAAATTTTITGDTPDPSLTGQPFTVAYSVSVNPPGNGTPSGNVTVSNGTDACVGTVAAGSCVFTPTTAGSQSLTATYAGDGNFASSGSTPQPHQVNPASTATVISSDAPDPTVTGQPTTVNYSVTVNSPGGGTPGGTVTVSDGTDSCTGSPTAGSCQLVSTTSGTKTLTATYAGTANYSGSSDTEAHVVNLASTTTAITANTPNPSEVGALVAVSYSVTPVAPGAGAPTGNVTVSDGTTSCVGTVAAGSCQLAFPTAGARTLTATYATDGNFSGSVSPGVSHTVVAAPTTATITSDLPDPSAVGQAVTVTYTVTSPGGTPTGNVTINDGGASCVGTVATGSCTLVPTTAAVDDLLIATYAGDGNFAPSTSAPELHTINPATTTTTITSDLPDPSVSGQPVTVAFSVTSPGGTPTGNVTVSDGASSCVASVAAGSCQVTFPTAGARTLTANYAGDANFSPSASPGEPHTVNQAATTTTIASVVPDPAQVGQAVTVSFGVTANAPGAGTPTGNVTVSDGAQNCVATAAAGSCQLTFTTAGARTLTATYAGDADFSGSTSVGVGNVVNPATTTASIASALPDPSTVGQTVTVNYAVTSAGGTPTGNVTVGDGATSCVATVAAGSCQLTFTTAGARTLTASYPGDGNFAASVSAGEPHTVNQAATTTAIVSDLPDPSTVGATVTVSYSVTSAGGTPTGNVTVGDGTTSCVGTVAAGSCQLAFPTAGVRTLTASYPGDANFSASTSVGASHTVDPAVTTTTITSNLATASVVGEPVAVDYSVTSPGGTPIGNVTVSDGTDSCVGTVAAGSCTLTLTTVGSRTITASYAGTTDFAPSTSTGVPHPVNQASTTTAILADDPDPSTVNQTIPVTYSVTVVAPGSGTPSGNVTISDGVDSCSGTVAAGQCDITLTNAGNRTLTASYVGDVSFAGSASGGVAHTVNQGPTVTTITSNLPNPSTVNQAVVVNYTVTSTAGTPTGNVTVSDGVDSCVGTIAAGTCSITPTTIGARTLTATYPGNTNYSGSSNATSQQVNPIPTVTLSSSAATLAEDGSDSPANLTATLSVISGRDVTVNLGYTGTATLTDDYTRSGTSISIPAGSTSGSVTLAAVQDVLDEDNETLIVDIASVVNGTESGVQQQTVTLIDDDLPPTVTLAAAPAAIGEAAGVSTLTATLSAVSGRAVTVNLGFSGTATLTTDYTRSATSISIPAGSPSGTATVNAVQDLTDELDETVIVDITTVTNGTESGVQQETVTITDDDAPPTVTLAAAPASIAEAAGASTLTATLSAASGQAVTVDLGFSGTATLTTDYTRSATSISIPAGLTSGTATVTAVQDPLDEPGETVIVDITTVTNGTESGVQQETITIADDDAPPTVTLAAAPAGIAEAAGVSTLTATLSDISGQAVTVDLGFSGTATLTTDYTRSATSITIPAGSTTETATVTAVQDLLDELDETVIVDVTTVTNGTESGVQQQTVTIADDDATPTVDFTAGAQSGAEDVGTLTVTAQLSAPSGQNVTVPFTVGGTATQGASLDYTITASPVVIAAGATTEAITITVNDDALDEPDNETVIVTMGTPVNADLGTTTVHTATITDNDGQPSVTLGVAPATLPEDGSANPATVTATLSNVSGLDVTVDLAFTGSATLTDDYTRSGTSIVIGAGNPSGTVTLAAVQDAIDEPDETVVVDIDAVTNGTESGTQQGTVTITDDDAEPAVDFTAASQSGSENVGTLTVTAQLAAVSGRDVTVPFTLSGTATEGAGADFTITPSPIVIAAGSTTGDITITVNDDALDEADNETVIVTMGALTNGTPGAVTVHTATITDNDLPPNVTLSAAPLAIAEAGGVSTLTATLSALSTLDVTVDLAFSGTATQTTDYTPSGTSIVILAGSLTGTATLTGVSDQVYEGATNETIIVDVAAVTNGTEAVAQQETVTITEDDSPPNMTNLNITTGPLVGGTAVTIFGSGFLGATGVTFGGALATNFVVVSATVITVTTPAGEGRVDVVLLHPGANDTLADAFAYTPTMASVTPTSGPQAGGTPTTITGAGFTDATGVTFGGAPGPGFSVVNSTTINVTTPSGTGVVDVVVQHPGGNAVLPASFTYIAPPTITSLDVTSGPEGGGTAVVITGTGFTGATGVTIGGAAATLGTVTATTINVTTPAGTPGAADVVVQHPGGDATLPGGFTYIAAPTITNVAPDNGPAAATTAVVITGTGFTGATAVTFGGVLGTAFSVIDDTTINVTTPTGTAGAVDVVVQHPGGNATLPGGYTYN